MFGTFVFPAGGRQAKRREDEYRLVDVLLFLVGLLPGPLVRNAE